jgi:hypothetical protein
MFKKVILCALASAAMMPAAAIAQRGGGPGGGAPGGPPAGVGGASNAGGFGSGGPGAMGNGGLGNGSAGDIGSAMRDQARMNSQGPANASAVGIHNANQNSVLAGTHSTTTVRQGALAGLTTGTTLFSDGHPVGTVQDIRMAGNGSVALLIVHGTNGGLYAVPANKLTFSGDMLSTTSHFAGINGSHDAGVSTRDSARVNSQGPAHASPVGIHHADDNSVLAGTHSAPTETHHPTDTHTDLPDPHSTTTDTHQSVSTHAGVAGSTHARINSQGPAHASPIGIHHANQNSVLAGHSTGTHTDIHVGMPLLVNGTHVGTVYRVITANGVVKRVLVQGSNGHIYSLAPNTLFASGGMLTTSTPLHGM